MANMTASMTARKSGSKMRSITFTHTAAGTADGTVASTEDINGTLLYIYVDDGGDAAWDLSLTVGGVVIWEETSLGTNALARPICVGFDGATPDAATDACIWGIPMSGQNLTCTTANMSGSGTGPAITVIFRED
jgi:hypothetical protein